MSMEFPRTDFNLFKVASVLTHASMQRHAWGKAHTILFQVEKAMALEPPEGTLVMGYLAVVVAAQPIRTVRSTGDLAEVRSIWKSTGLSTAGH